jgi:hypothetical protein
VNDADRNQKVVLEELRLIARRIAGINSILVVMLILVIVLLLAELLPLFNRYIAPMFNPVNVVVN